jgi:hypothetical protein
MRGEHQNIICIEVLQCRDAKHPTKSPINRQKFEEKNNIVDKNNERKNKMSKKRNKTAHLKLNQSLNQIRILVAKTVLFHLTLLLIQRYEIP